MRHRELIGRIATLATSAVAAAISVHLLGVHLDVETGAAMTGLCGMSDTVNCGSVADSAYSSLLGIPIALFGLAYYVSAFILALFNPGGNAPTRVHRPAALLQTLYLLSTIYSIFLLVVSLSVLQAFCPYCGMLYAMNIVGVATTWVWLGAGPHRILPQQVREIGTWIRMSGSIVAAVVFVISVGAGMLVLDGMKNARLDARALLEELQDTPVVDTSELVPAHAGTKGPVDAPVTLVEFSNFGCPFCGRLAESVDALMQTHGDRVRVVYRHFPIRPDQHEAAMATVCAAEQDQFWPLHDTFFARLAAREPVTDRAGALRIAAELGIDIGSLEECLDSGRARDAVEADRAQGMELGVQGTPTFYINGRQHVGALPPAELRRLVEAALRTP